MLFVKTYLPGLNVKGYMVQFHSISKFIVIYSFHLVWKFYLWEKIAIALSNTLVAAARKNGFNT